MTDTPPEFEDDPDGRRISRQQHDLDADLDAVLAYGLRHADEWTGVRFENADPVRLVAAFTRNVDMHRRALKRILDHPDLLVVQVAPHSAKELERIRGEIEAMTASSSRVKELGSQFDNIHVQLAATGEDLAAELRSRYGNALEIVVGTFPYPPNADHRPGRVTLPAPTVSLPDLELDLVLDATEVTSGEDIFGRLIVRNRGVDALPLEGGRPLVGMVVRPGTDEVAGCFTGAVPGVGWSAVLGPGDELPIPSVIGTASCVLEDGYTLRPGTYGAVVPLELFGEEDAQGKPRTDVILSPEVLVALK